MNSVQNMCKISSSGKHHSFTVERSEKLFLSVIDRVYDDSTIHFLFAIKNKPNFAYLLLRWAGINSDIRTIDDIAALSGVFMFHGAELKEAEKQIIAHCVKNSCYDVLDKIYTIHCNKDKFMAILLSEIISENNLNMFQYYHQCANVDIDILFTNTVMNKQYFMANALRRNKNFNVDLVRKEFEEFAKAFELCCMNPV
jgi:hypothetical protein